MDSSIPSSIRVAFCVEGSRGDIQPYLAIARTLQDRGNVVRIFTNEDHVSFCESVGISVEGVFYSFQQAFGNPTIQKALAKGNALQMAKGLREIRFDHLGQDLRQMWPALESFQPTILLSGGIAKSKTMLYSNLQNIPLVVVDLQVLIPVSDKAPAGLPTIPFGYNKLWWKLLLAGASQHLTKMKAVAKESLPASVVDRIDGALELPMMHAMLTEIESFPGPFCVGISNFVIPPHPEWPRANFYPCGFFTMQRDHQTQLAQTATSDTDARFFGTATTHSALQTFLDAGPPPVYLGWGSMMCKTPAWMTRLALEALQQAGARGIILGGWAGLSLELVPADLVEFASSTQVLFVETCPHEWLFPHCACIVHHGGSGTTAASVRSGRPTIITPIQGDQFDFADGVSTMGCGMGLPHLASVTSNLLGESIAACLASETIQRTAQRVGAQLQSEDGCQNFCQILDDWIDKDIASGIWHSKQEALMKKCQESYQASRNRSILSHCTIS